MIGRVERKERMECEEPGRAAEAGERRPAAGCDDGEALLAARGLAVGYDGTALLSDVDLTAFPGQVTTIVGPNGSGKSTLLKTLARQLRPLGGQVFLEGRDLSLAAAGELARTVAVMLTQRPGTELLTCRDVVEAGRYPYTGRLGVLGEADHAAVREAMELASVWDLRERDFMRVSDGQRQRVLTARALCQEPRVLVLDEPTSYLDVRWQVGLLGLLRRLAKERRMAVVMSLHELDLAQKASDRVLCAKDGRIVHSGTPEDVFTREVIGALYDLDGTAYNPLFASVELERPKGAPRVFVVAGGGTGTGAFRALARAGVPFVAGVLHENDVDCALAGELAGEVVTERAFEPIGDVAFERAREALSGCEAVIACTESFGTTNARNKSLLEAAQAAGIPIHRTVEACLESLTSHG